jgi:chromosomal replication initiator protein
MQPLDQKTREDLLRQWAQQRQVCLSPAVMRAVAEHVGGDARHLSGVLNRLRAISEATGEPVTSQVVRDVLCELYPQTPRMIRLPDVERAVCQVFGLAPHSLQTGGRARSISHPRMLAMWLARKHTRAGLAEISEFFGRRSHSTVVSANHTVDGWIDTSASLCFNHQDRNIHEIVGELESQLKAG